ncbi:hypothetical protein Slin15195_G060670 [Septoria linicola]|uniref:Uncharacterized protein n=1 Tax=Septoria linicola TaxID=215465 RepID=A0A9Q9AT79_9PEZI|nr:hypothetical protein Slin15195_G060670 [Septoria linicola]
MVVTMFMATGWTAPVPEVRAGEDAAHVSDNEFGAASPETEGLLKRQSILLPVEPVQKASMNAVGSVPLKNKFGGLFGLDGLEKLVDVSVGPRSS